MTAAENYRSPARPRLRQFVIGDQQIVRPRNFTVVQANVNTVPAQQRMNKVGERRITYRQPAANLRQPVNRQRRSVLLTVQRNAQRKLAPHTRLGIYRDIAVHHIDQLFTNRQPQPGPLEVTLYAGPHLEEWVKQAHHFFRRDADTGITNADAEVIPFALQM